MILNADARAIPLADESVQTVVTSPPYWGLRDYGNGDAGIGLEPTPRSWVLSMVSVFEEIRRVLRPNGTVWLNVGDAYSSSGGQRQYGSSDDATGRGAAPGTRLMVTKSKDLIGLPWRLAFALQDEGWYLRSDIIWAKPNPMPESVRDRPTKAHEYLFLLTKSPRYYFDADAVRLPAAEASIGRWAQNVEGQEGSDRANGGAKTNGPMRAVGGPRARKNRTIRDGIDTNGGGQGGGCMDYPALTANIRSVWTIPTQPFREAHFATFPAALVLPCIKAGSAEGDLVLDPFAGSGTTCVVARKLARRYVGLELNPDYCDMARRRIDRETPPNLFDTA